MSSTPASSFLPFLNSPSRTSSLSMVKSFVVQIIHLPSLEMASSKAAAVSTTDAEEVASVSVAAGDSEVAGDSEGTADSEDATDEGDSDVAGDALPHAVNTDVATTSDNNNALTFM